MKEKEGRGGGGGGGSAGRKGERHGIENSDIFAVRFSSLSKISRRVESPFVNSVYVYEARLRA